jgi:hypothetical protein
MLATFKPHPDMLAIELAHHIVAPLPLHMAQLITMELGNASFRSPSFDAWYAIATVEQNVGLGFLTLLSDIPFCLRVDAHGNASVTLPWTRRDLWSAAVASLVPEIVVEAIPVRAMR